MNPDDFPHPKTVLSSPTPASGHFSAAGRLRVSVECAAAMIHACGVGVALTFIADGDRAGDLRLSEMTREAIISATTTSPTSRDKKTCENHSAIQHAVALKAHLPKAAAEFSPAERALLASWLDRLAGSPIGAQSHPLSQPSSRSDRRERGGGEAS